MKTVFAAAALAAAAVAESLGAHELAFMRYIAEWNKSYATREEFTARMANWIEAELHVREVNAPGSGYTHRAGHNKTSDWTREEYLRLLTYKAEPRAEDAELWTAPEGFTAPASVDWSTGNCVTAVKDQGQCGSCWAFSATESTESSNCIAGGSLYTLAPQQLVDCAGIRYGNFGCNGGMYYGGWKYTKEHGQELESAYPYTAKDGSCTASASKGKVKTPSWTSIAENSTSIMAAIATMPASVAIDASSRSFQQYSSGVYTGTCTTTIDHAVQAVGYNNNSNPYYIVRNSWGSSWGNHGYIWMAITGGAGTCGINSTVYTVNAVPA